MKENQRLRSEMEGGISSSISERAPSPPGRGLSRRCSHGSLAGASSPGYSSSSRRGSRLPGPNSPPRSPGRSVSPPWRGGGAAGGGASSPFDVAADFPARRFPPPASFTLGLSPRSPRSPDPRHVFEEALTRDWQNALRDGASEGLFAVHGVDGP